MSNDWIAVGVQEVLVVYRFEIKPRPAALGGGVRLYLYGPRSGNRRRDRAGRRRLSGKGIPGSTHVPALKATLSAVNCFWSFCASYLLSS
jgi:hypothetical protein